MIQKVGILLSFVQVCKINALLNKSCVGREAWLVKDLGLPLIIQSDTFNVGIM